MSTVYHYKSNLRDLYFNLFELFKIQETSLGKEPFTSMGEDEVREALNTLEQLAVKELAESFADADRVGLTFDGEGNVTLPESIKTSMDAFYEGGWHLFELPESMGGFGVSPSVIWSSYELMAGANPAMVFYLFGGFIGKIIQELGTESQRARYIPQMIEKRWGGTMVLTEPDAGSDVGAGRTKATHVEGDVWEIEGVKRFITNGDYDYAENIVHLVLARPEGHAPGTKGLSLFIVPKFWVNEDGSLGERNGAVVTNVEKKMGIKASATCEITFGEKMPCKGLLVGEVHNGIAQMFRVIENARMAVGMKSVTTLSTAYLNALEFTKERVQGPDLANILDKTAPKVTIIHHPDVRRMLMDLKCHAEGLRALGLYAAWLLDQEKIAGGRETEEGKAFSLRNDMMLPLVKGYSSEKVYELLTLALQCYGGSGYLMDYPIEQYIRDQKIDSLYEGVTGIQALDLIFRKIMRDGGATLTSLLNEVRETIDSGVGGDELAESREALLHALGDLQAIFGFLTKKAPESLYYVGIAGNKVLFSLAETVIGWLLLRQGGIAVDRLAEGVGEADQLFYSGKVAAVKHFCNTVLPGIKLQRKLIENTDLSLMELPEEAF